MARKPSIDGVVVIGLGRFGAALARELERDGVEVLGIDSDPEVVREFAGEITHVVHADSTDEDALRQLSVQDFDRAVIGIGTHLEASVLTASTLLGLGIGNVWAKAVSAPHARILEQLGVHHVVRPENDSGTRVAHLVRGRMLDYIEFDDGYAMVKMGVPAPVVGMPLGESVVRTVYDVTVVGVKRPGAAFTYATAETVLNQDDVIIAAGDRRKVERFSALT